MTNLTNTNLLKKQAYINGKWVPANSGKTFTVFNPFDGSELASIADLGVSETQQAVQAAYNALPAWRAKTARERSDMLKKWAQLVQKNFLDNATLLSLEQGKPIEQAKSEISYAITFLEWYANAALYIHGQTLQQPSPNTRLFTVKEPIGVVAAIAPWNFPATLCIQKCAPAIAAGCTVVFKPAQDTPLTALALAQLAEEAGIPQGVFNVITCEKPEEVGYELTNHPLVRKLTFTGSTAVGKRLASQASGNVKKLCMELGGNCPLIIFNDADIEAAVNQAFGLKFFNSGQVCNNVNRFLVQDSVYDQVVEKFYAKAKELKVGSGLDPNSNIGPLINGNAIKKIERLVQDALSKGATLKLGGKLNAKSKLCYEPTILTEMPTSALMYHEEIFGPVAPFYRFKTENEAIEMANDTEFGLAAYVFTSDQKRLWHFSNVLEAGSVGMNTTNIFSELAPFGGFKSSGIGREGGLGSIESYCEVKTLALE